MASSRKLDRESHEVRNFCLLGPTRLSSRSDFDSTNLSRLTGSTHQRLVSSVERLATSGSAMALVLLRWYKMSVKRRLAEALKMADFCDS